MSNKPVPSRGNGKLPNGAKLAHGQLHLMPHRAGKSAPPGAFRKFGEKALPTPEPVIGHARREAKGGHPLAFVGGTRPLNDETADKLCINGKTVPVHNGMGSETPEHRGADYGPNGGSDILSRTPRDWDKKHGDIDKAARLPSKR